MRLSILSPCHRESGSSLLLRCGLLLVLACIIPSAYAAANPLPSSYARWAIIATGDGEAAAVRDLAYAELSDQPGIALVERDELAKVTNELLLTQALDPEGSASRLQLGAMLNADAVIVLQLLGEGDQRTLRVVVVDCRQGTRLRLETLPWQAEKAPALAAHLCELAVILRRQYAAGIQKIVGVPNFVSRSFSRDYDPLQAQYSELLQQVLLLEPGVAVIETDEAQAIGREMAIEGRQSLARVVPLLVQGDFRVETPAGAPPTVSLTVKLADRTGAIATADSGPLALDEAPKWITTALPAKVTAGGVNAKPLSVDEQAQALSARGETFAVLGSYDQSIPLRECAVLLNPDLPQTRMALVDEYFKRYSTEFQRTAALLIQKYQAGGMKADTPVLQDPEMEAAMARIAAGYVSALEHAEYLIGHRQLSGAATHDLLARLRLFGVTLEPLARESGKPAAQQPAGLSHLAEAEQARRRFLLAVIPLVMCKPDTGNDGPQLTAIIAEVYSLSQQNLERGWITLEILAFVRQAAELVPDDFLPLNLPNFYRYRVYFAPEVTEAAYLQFLEGACGSPRLLVRADAAAILLYRRFQRAEAAGDKAELLAVQGDVQALTAKLNAAPSPYAGALSRADATLYFRNDLRKAIAKLEQGPAPAAVQDTGALCIEKYTLRQAAPTRSSTPFTGLQFIPCGTFDVVWSSRVLYFHRTAGVLEPAALPETGNQLFLTEVIWDGQYAWAATNSKGLWVIGADGKLIRQIAQPDGLPPYDGSLRLYPAAPGRILAVGSFGKDERAWCAIVTLAEGGASVHVFHEGIEVPTAADETNRQAIKRNPNTAFRPLQIVKVAGARPGDDPVVAVVRQLDRPARVWGLDPLMINLATLQVGIWDPGLQLQPYVYIRPVLLTAQGTVLGYDNTANIMHRLSAVKTENGPTLYPISVTNPGPVIPDSKDRYNREHVDHLYPGDAPTVLTAADGLLYVAGDEWWRVDPATLTAQRLTRGKLPEQYRLHMAFGYSSLLGLIAWNDDGLYLVTIDEGKIPKTDE